MQFWLNEKVICEDKNGTESVLISPVELYSISSFAKIMTNKMWDI